MGFVATTTRKGRGKRERAFERGRVEGLTAVVVHSEDASAESQGHTNQRARSKTMPGHRGKDTSEHAAKECACATGKETPSEVTFPLPGSCRDTYSVCVCSYVP